MDLKLSHCFVTVHDQEAALTFYRDVFGLEVPTDVAIGPMRWLNVAAPSDADGTELSLKTPDALFAKAVAAGAEVVQEPPDQPYGVRDCAVRDPSINMVRLAQPLFAGNHPRLSRSDERP